MEFRRFDSVEGDTIHVKYITTGLVIDITKRGISIVGSTERLTDLTELNNVLRKAHYQYQSLQEKGRAMSEKELGYPSEDEL